MADDSQPVLQFDQVTWRPRPDADPILSQVSLSVSPGRVLGLVGPSGSGKSTLLRLGNRLISASDGAVRFDGRDVADLDVHHLRRRVQLMHQKPVVFPGTVRDNLYAAADFAGVDRPDDDAMRELLERAGLNVDRLDQEADTLSVGQQQRMSLARSLLLEPRVLLADEPTAALDEAMREQIIDQFAELVSGNGLSLVLVGHPVEQVARVADELAVLIDGRLADHGPAQRVLDAPSDDATAEFLNGQMRRG